MTPSPVPSALVKRKRRRKTLYERLEPWLFLLPALAVFVVFLYYPFFKTVYLSAFLTNRYGEAKVFVGLKNYTDILTGTRSGEFWNSIWVTVRFVFFVTLGGLTMGIVTSLLVEKRFPGNAFASAIFAMPIAIASSAASMSFKMILHPSIGLLNKLLGTQVNWLNDIRYTFGVICVLAVWLATGINFIFISAGLRNIPGELYESAAIDGANGWDKFRCITLPCLSPTLFFQVIIDVINAFQTFNIVKILTLGGPMESTNTIVYSIYLDAFRNFRFGSAAARSIILFLIIMTVTLIQFRAEKRSVHYS
ncbi:MAG: sugar ABC transporter permease [Clostridia bacterium]|nr:sugar ABC transporter permease [Clostridia bacterium]